MLQSIDAETLAKCGNDSDYCPGKLREMALGIEDAIEKQQGDIVLSRPHAVMIYRAMMDHADLIERYT